MSANEKCRYMEAAYPTLDAEDTCGYADHRHDESTFTLARAFAIACQDENPSDEQIGWFLEDAAAVVDDFDAGTVDWTVTPFEPTDIAGLESAFTINDRPYVVQPSEWEPSHPVSLTRWHEWEDEDCCHNWEIRPESDTRTCLDCGAER